MHLNATKFARIHLKEGAFLSFSVTGAAAVAERRGTSREPADNKGQPRRQTEMNKEKYTDES